MSRAVDLIAALVRTPLPARGHRHGTRFFLRLCGLALASLGRPRLVIEQIGFVGNYSLSITGGLGLLRWLRARSPGLLHPRALCGSSEALGLMVALSLVRELGPVVTALLFAGRVGTS